MIFVFDGDRMICSAHVEKTYGVLDRAGSKELARRRKYVHREIALKGKGCALLDLVKETERHNRHLLDTPDAPVATVIDAGAIDRMAEADQAARKALAGVAPAPRKTLEQFKAGPNVALQKLKYAEDVDA